MTTHRKWVIGYFIAFIVMIVMNYTVGMSGSSVGDAANNNETIIQPAGFAFSIWGLIYILLFVWMIYLFFSKKDKSPITARLKFWPILNFLLNGAWIIVFTQEWVLASVIIIAALLYTLAEIFTSISETGNHWFDRIPFSIYFAWVTVATIVNIFTLATANNVDTILGMDELTWTIIILIVAALIGLAIGLFFKDWLYPLVLIWPFAGIYAESGDMYTTLDVTLAVISLALVVVAVSVIVNRLKSPNPRTY
ncbi:TspO/MBR family protein [Oceanobacillus sp. CAU 1775]